MDQTQVVQKHTANGVVAQNQMECEDNKLPDHSTNTSAQISDPLVNSSLLNGERESTTIDSLPTTTACEGQILNSCCRTPSSSILLPSEKETVETNIDVEEEQNDELDKQDQLVEAKVKQYIKSFVYGILLYQMFSSAVLCVWGEKKKKKGNLVLCCF